MKYFFLTILLVTSLSCKLQEEAKPEKKNSNGTNERSDRVITPKGFDYKTTYTFNKTFLLRNEDNSPASNISVTVSYEDTKEQSKVLAKFNTNTTGELKLSLSIPAHISKLKLQYQGLKSNIIRTIIARRGITGMLLESLLDLFFPRAMAQDLSPSQVSYFPSQCTFGTLGFEDLWPTHGDQDFNDLVVNYNFAQNIDANNEITSMDITIQFVASGAGYSNGFAIELPISKDKISSISGNLITDNYLSFEESGVEAGHDKAVIIISDDVSQQIPKFSNVYEGRFLFAPYEFKVTVNFNTGVKVQDLSMPPYNPFIIVNKDRGREVHLPDYAPTKLADKKHFGQYHDDSVPESGRYYKDSGNNPWAIHIPVAFNYMREKQKINNGHKNFATWATSKGQSFNDWYLGKEGYRNDYFLFKKSLPLVLSPIITCEDEENTVTVTIKDGAEAEEVIDTIQVSEISINETHYEDNYSTNVNFQPFNNMDGKRELLYAKVSYNLSPSVSIVGKNIGGNSYGSAIVSSSQDASLSWSNGTLANDSFSRLTNIAKIYSGTFNQYLEFLNNGSHHTRFPKFNYSEDFRGQFVFSGDDLTIFQGANPISFTLDHSVTADLNSYEGSQVSVDTNFRIQGSVIIKYIWRQFGTSGVKFNDLNLENALRIKLGVWSGGINSAHCSGVETLDLSGYGITDLKGLEICTDLKTLNLNDNNLSNIDLLSNLSQLKKLYLKKNNISNLQGLSELLSLERLDLSENEITNLSPLSNLISMKYLYFHKNSVADISPLSKMVILDTLQGDWNSIVKVDAISNLANLRSIQLRFNQIDDGTPFGTLPDIRYLNLRTNKLKKFDWISNSTSLSHLVVSDNQISALPNLEKLDLMTGLYLDNNPITNLTNLAPVKDTMVTMLLSNTQLQNTSELKDMPKLTTLHLNNITVDMNDLITSPLLVDLNFTNNNILNKEQFHNLTNLKYLNLHGSGITAVDFLTSNTALQRLYMNHNDIVDLSPIKEKFPDLSRLYVSHSRNLNCSSINTLWYYKFRKVNTTWNYEPEDCVITERDPLTDFSSIFTDYNLSYQVRNTIDKMSGDLVAADLLGKSTLKANNMSIESLEGIQYWPSLTHLELATNTISDISPLLSLPNLDHLNISGNPVTTLPELLSRDNITELNISDTQIKEISELLNMPSLSKVTMTGLDLGCEQLIYVNQLAAKNITVEVSPFTNCNQPEYLLEEESSASLIQHASTDLSSNDISYSESSEQELAFGAFDNLNDTVELLEAKITFTIVSSISGLAKNFNSSLPLTGSLEISNTVLITSSASNQLALPLGTSYSDLSKSLGFTNSFDLIPQSTVQDYQDYRSSGSNTEKFKEVDLDGTNEIIITFTGSELNFFKAGSQPTFKVNLESNASVKSGNEDLLYDFDSSTNVQIKVEYKYQNK